jgi:hypothetical protein
VTPLDEANAELTLHRTHPEGIRLMSHAHPQGPDRPPLLDEAASEALEATESPRNHRSAVAVGAAVAAVLTVAAVPFAVSTLSSSGNDEARPASAPEHPARHRAGGAQAVRANAHVDPHVVGIVNSQTARARFQLCVDRELEVNADLPRDWVIRAAVQLLVNEMPFAKSETGAEIPWPSAPVPATFIVAQARGTDQILTCTVEKLALRRGAAPVDTAGSGSFGRDTFGGRFLNEPLSGAEAMQAGGDYTVHGQYAPGVTAVTIEARGKTYEATLDNGVYLAVLPRSVGGTNGLGVLDRTITAFDRRGHVVDTIGPTPLSDDTVSSFDEHLCWIAPDGSRVAAYDPRPKAMRLEAQAKAKAATRPCGQLLPWATSDNRP